MKRGLMLTAVVAALVASALPAAGITDGGPDGDDHPYVGLMVAYDSDGEALWRCSGTLIDPSVFLTAGHCTEEPAVTANIWFLEDVQAVDDTTDFPGRYYENGSWDASGTTHPHPQYDPAAFYLYDAGVVALDEPVVMDTYGALPSQGLADTIATARGRKDTSITAVGYGLQRINPVFIEAQKVRLQATLELVDVKGTAGVPAGTSITVSGDAHHGGTCFGDSGGPMFFNDTNVVVAVTSFGLNGNCTGIGGGYRVDQPDDLDWVGSFLS